MSKIRRRRHGKTRDGRLLWRMKICFHLFVTKGQCGHYVRFKNDGCPVKQADEILANPDSDLATLSLIKCTRYKEFIRHPTVFMLQIVDPKMYKNQLERPCPIRSLMWEKSRPVGSRPWQLKWPSEKRRLRVVATISAVFDCIRKKMESLGYRSSFPEFKSRRKMHKVRRMSICNVRKFSRRVNRFKQTFALMLLKDKYGRSRL